MSDERMFPIQRGTPIPWHEAEKAYRTYAEHYGESQSLERLAQRGGFGVSEFACLYNGHRPKKHEDGNYCPFPDFESTKLKVEIAALRAELATAKAHIAELKAERDGYLETLESIGRVVWRATDEPFKFSSTQTFEDVMEALAERGVK